MKETTTSPRCCPPGSQDDAPDELEENRAMEIKQVILHKRSEDAKQHRKKNGVLTAEVVSRCVSNIGRLGTGLQHVYHHLCLPNQDLSDISVLCSYVHLQKLQLSHNKIKDLSCVSHMPYLVVLDASHNDISNFFEFQPPKNLKEVNFSHNRITKMKDLSAFSSLSHLDLGYNSFSEIGGLEQCCKITNLSLEHNNISRVSGLDTLPLTHLCLRGNKLERIEGLDKLTSLQVLDLSLNRVATLSGLQHLHLLGSINLEKNLISEIQECKHIRDLFLLRDFNLLGNPVQEQPDYRLSVIFLLQHLTGLDQEKVTAEEKVSSVNKYDPPLDLVAARDHMTQLVYHLMQPQVLYDSSTMPSADSPYPMLVLTGPQGCGKRDLAHRLCHDLSEYFAYGISHTTRRPYFEEEDGIDYHFVSEEDFQSMIQMGKFIQTTQYGGHRYGLTRDAIEEVAKEGLACCVHMELEGVLSLKNTYFEPRYILLIPTQAEKYMGHMKSRGLYSAAQIDVVMSRVELYGNTNRQRPGFFDNVIPCDNWEEAYQTLRQIVKEYLLVEEQEEEEEEGGENNNRASPDNNSTDHESEEKPEEKPQSRAGSGALAAPPAAALDPSDLSYRNYFNKIQAALSPPKSAAELASIRRREQLVREAIVGKSLGIYSQLFKSPAPTAASSGWDPDPHLSEDSSGSGESRASSALTVPGSAGGFSGSAPPLDSSALEHTLETIKGETPDAPHPDAELLSAAASPSSDRRPGSNAKPILPPIPSGRKTPASPSPAPSPRPGPNTAGAEGGDADREG
ncbi:leucine-rich repeat and guanylate kinase domain-containing protein [Pseudoliparis swirei]|uniref:leucine-rich repeat and guanylate kinase domain-containing protein n=1 Tax=Pseudoliparis swirei TaxID=2059687 RepID=UPI0024BE865F|nr:leucine-rich repeat and guanylate kinase domain-containing protein [Pseudoliparis swirei]